jgi:hypothetical protein
LKIKYEYSTRIFMRMTFLGFTTDVGESSAELLENKTNSRGTTIPRAGLLPMRATLSHCVRGVRMLPRQCVPYSAKILSIFLPAAQFKQESH